MSTERPADTTDIADLSYEAARDELVAIVARIEGGSVSLEESMALWERGEALAAHCQAKLDQAQDQLDRGASAPGGPTAPDTVDESDGAGTQAADERDEDEDDIAAPVEDEDDVDA